MCTVDQYLYGIVQSSPDDEFEEVRGDQNRSASGKSLRSQPASARSYFSSLS